MQCNLLSCLTLLWIIGEYLSALELIHSSCNGGGEGEPCWGRRNRTELTCQDGVMQW